MKVGLEGLPAVSPDLDLDPVRVGLCVGVLPLDVEIARVVFELRVLFGPRDHDARPRIVAGVLEPILFFHIVPRRVGHAHAARLVAAAPPGDLKGVPLLDQAVVIVGIGGLPARGRNAQLGKVVVALIAQPDARPGKGERPAARGGRGCGRLAGAGHLQHLADVNEIGVFDVVQLDQLVDRRPKALRQFEERVAGLNGVGHRIGLLCQRRGAGPQRAEREDDQDAQRPDGTLPQAMPSLIHFTPPPSSPLLYTQTGPLTIRDRLEIRP